jgi:uncharacterized protein (TIRG00374 family)
VTPGMLPRCTRHWGMAAEAVQGGLDDTALQRRRWWRPRSQQAHRLWAGARYVLGIGIVVVVLWALSSHRGELSGLSSVIANLNWWWVPPALLAETLSFISFAFMQSELLKAAGLKAPWNPLLKVTVANQAIANSLPGGNAASAVYVFRWFRRFGADDTLATWAMLGSLIASAGSLSTVAVAGLALATGEGASLDLIPVIIGVFLLTVAVGALFIYERPLLLLLTWSVRVSHKLIGRPRGDTSQQVERVVHWITAVHLGWRQVRTIFAWGAANWLFDCACFAMMFFAVGTTIPWKGLLLAYGAGQLAATLPITPGGLGVVEGSITIALVAFGGARSTTVDAVLLYRFISFWLVLVVGWALWGELALQVRRGRWSRYALDATVEAGLQPAADADPGVRNDAQAPMASGR